MNPRAVESRYKAAIEVGRKGTLRGLSRDDINTLFRSCSDVPELLDYIKQLRAQVAEEIETFAAQCLTQAERVEGEMTTCANDQNLGVVETYRQAANIARAGISYKNTNCTKCYDTRGGPEGHKTEDCTLAPPVGLFEEKDQCYGRDLVQVGWAGPYGIIPGGMDNDPVPNWRPIFMHKVT